MRSTCLGLYKSISEVVDVDPVLKIDAVFHEHSGSYMRNSSKIDHHSFAIFEIENLHILGNEYKKQLK